MLRLGALLLLVAASQAARYDSQGSWPGSCNAPGSMKQSPIDIQDFKGACDNSIKLDLKRSADNMNFTVVVASEADPGYMKATFTGGTVASLYASDLNGNIFGYDLSEMRLHSPSEHTIEGQSFAVELQMYFALRTEFKPQPYNWAVMSFLFKESEDKKVPIDILTLMQSEATSQNQQVSTHIKNILPSPLSYFTYEGSDTVPNCSQDVLWYVVEKPIEISTSQANVFNSMYQGKSDFAGGAGNNRNVKALNNRVIKKGGVECEEQFIYFFSFVLLYAFINYFIFKLL